MSKLLLLVLISIAFAINGNAQPLNNLEVFFNLVDSSYQNYKDDIPDNVRLDYQGDNGLAVLKDRFIFNIRKDGKAYDQNSGNEVKLIFYKVNVNYDYSESANIINGYDIEREFNCKGSLMIYQDGKLTRSGEFYKTFKDTVGYDQVSGLENSGLNFTHSEMPEESFFSSLVEPLIAIAAIATTIYLLFTVRSN